ncbi:MAG: thiol:disulfide interchange protein DsbA/DsbL [Deltaproteobacteria bacterium]|jgi:thiol:disulfide interchange protein DsbA|nr:thiol:disulfide interchange protein DsbA/DsbL [Deltaproteobacteria bacterium]
MIRHFFSLILVVSLSLALSLTAFAQVGASQGQATAPTATLPTIGPPTDANGNLKPILRPSRLNDTDDKIEVVYLFWYGCGHCRQTDAATTMFLNSLPSDVRVERIHVLFDGASYWRAHGRLFYTLDQLGVEKTLHSKIFETIFQNARAQGGALSLITPQSQETFAAANGIARAAFKAAFDSPDVIGRMERVIAFTDNSGIDAVPGFIINGRYQYTYFGGPAFYQQAEMLINLERERLKALKEAQEPDKAAEPSADNAKALEPDQTQDQTKAQP